MLGIFSIALIFTIFQAVTSEDVPEHCRRPPPGIDSPGDCCKLPHIFAEEDFKECGIENPKLHKARGPPDCSKNICLLKRYNLTKDDENVDKEALAAFLDEFSDTYPEFKDTFEKAKEKCLSTDLPGPPHICEPNRISFCVIVTMFNECPVWEDNENCKKLKDHMEECKAYLPF